MSDICKCRKCGNDPFEASDRGAFLKRVNPIGETPMIVECYPSCEYDSGGGFEESLINAIENGAKSPDDKA